MEWPHDPDGEEGSEGGRKYGLAVIAKKLDDDDLPVTRGEFLDGVGEDPVRLDDDRVVPVSDLLEHMADGPFDTREAFLTAVGASMRAGGYWTFESERYQRL